MAHLARALDRETGRRVALKTSRRGAPKLEARLEREAELLAQLRHPGIVAHVAHGRTGSGRLFLAMEWLEGEDLATRLARGRLPPGEALVIARQAAEALAHVHAAGVIHRDVKPANLFLPGRRVDAVKLLDFGVATTAGGGETPGFVGTPGYLAPEQARNEPEIDAAADVFALGVVLYECLTGMPAYAGSNVMALVAKAALSEPPRLEVERPDLPGVAAVLARMLAPDPTARFRDGDEAARALRSLESGEVRPSLRPPSPPPRLGTDERAITSVIVVGSGLAELGSTLATRQLEVPPAVWPAIEAADARVQELVDGSLLVTVRSARAAEAAARLALDLRGELPGEAIAVVTGMAPVGDRGAVGPLIDRATGLLEGAPLEGVRIDALTAELVRSRVRVREGEHGLELVEGAATDGGPTLRGRDAELRRLEGALAACVDRREPATVSVVGPPGAGKTTLVDALASRARERFGARVVRVHGDPIEGEQPFRVLAALLRDAIGVRRRDPPSRRRARLRDALAGDVEPEDLAPALAFGAELIGAPLVDGEATDSLRAARMDEALMAAPMQETFERWLAAESARAPVLIVVDDAHHADRASLRALAHAVGASRGPWLFVPAARAPAPDPVAREGAEVLALGPLDEASPAGALASTQARLASLPGALRRVLRAASVFGNAFRAEGLSPLVPDLAPVDGAAQALVGLGLIAPLERDGVRVRGAYAFASGLVREAAYDTFTDDDRRAAHGLAARWLAEREDAGPRALAEHWERAGDVGRALEHLLAAASRALEAHDYEQVLALTRRGEAWGAEGTLAGALARRAADAHHARGELRESVAMARRAMESLPERSDDWFAAASARMRAACVLGLPEGFEVAEQLASMEPEPHQRVPLVLALAAGSRFLTARGRYELSALLFERVESLASALHAHGPYVDAWIQSTRATASHRAGDLDAFRRHMIEALDGFTAIRDLESEAVHRVNLAHAHNELGAPDDAERELTRALDLAEARGMERLAAAALMNLGATHLHKGQPADAIPLLLWAEERFDETGDDRLVGACRHYRSKALLRAGRHDDAERAAEAALESLAAVPPLRAPARAQLAAVRLERGDVAAAREIAERAFAELKDLGHAELDEELVLLTRARVLAACGEALLARHTVLLAVKELEERAARIRDEAARAAFLSARPERVALLALR